MNAQQITTSLGGKWYGRYGYVKCVAHEDGNPSLRLSDGEQGKLLVSCHSGCNPVEILRSLRARHYLESDAPKETPEQMAKREAERAERDRWTQQIVDRIWRATDCAAGTATERYLRARGIGLEMLPTIRHHRGLRHPDDKKKYQCMVAAVQAPGRKITGVHRTFITPAGRKLAMEKVKFAFGPTSPGAVRLAAAAEEMAVGEGIETCLSYMECRAIPTWAALSTSGMRSVQLPPLPLARIVHIAADNDENKAGEMAADALALRLRKEGREVVIDFPPGGLKDFNDCAVGHAGR